MWLDGNCEGRSSARGWPATLPSKARVAAGYFLVLHKKHSHVFVQMKEDLSPRKTTYTCSDYNLIFEDQVSFYGRSCCFVLRIYI